MKSTTRFNFTFLAVFLFLAQVSAQRFEVNAIGGASNYQGDLADGYLIMKETRPAFGGFIRYMPMKQIGVRAGFMYGHLHGSDQNSTDKALLERNFEFSSSLREMSLIGEYNFFNTADERRSYGLFRLSYTAYLYSGIVFTSTDGTPKAPGDRLPYPFPEAGSKNNFIGVPVGVGARIQFSNEMSAGVDFGWRTVFSDYLDGVSKAGNPNRRDWYVFGGITLTYIIDTERF